MLVPAALADNGGLGFWPPGVFCSLAAVPLQPGLTFTSEYIYQDLATHGATDVHVQGNIGAILPTYAFETPVLGAQLALTAAAVPGNLKLTVTQPGGSASDTRSTVGDVYYLATLKWNANVNNYMTYVAGNIPSGTYNPARLSNISIGYVGFDTGAGYTYFNPANGHEFSAVAGFSFNGPNAAVNYQNGVDFHVDLAASQSISKMISIGLVGYGYQQVTADSGVGAVLGAYKSAGFGLGPQVSFFFPAWSGYTAWLNLRSYIDLYTANRPKGTTAMMVLTFTPTAAAK